MRSAFSVERIAENMSPLHQTLVSTDSDTGILYCSTCSVGACPCPALHSDSVETEIDLVPHAAKSREIDAVLSNSFGFGGTNASLVFRRAA